jgi:predicted dithiol-disulfide oxidoreductase (DUF899 family)
MFKRVMRPSSLEKLVAYKKRMGWTFEWVSSGANDFNCDFGVSFRKSDLEAKRAIYNYAPLTFEASDLSGVSVFLKDPRGRSIIPIQRSPVGTRC